MLFACITSQEDPPPSIPPIHITVVFPPPEEKQRRKGRLWRSDELYELHGSATIDDLVFVLDPAKRGVELIFRGYSIEENGCWLLEKLGFKNVLDKNDNLLVWKGVGYFGRATYEIVEEKGDSNSNNIGMNHLQVEAKDEGGKPSLLRSNSGRNGFRNTGRTEGESFRSKIDAEENWMDVKQIGEDGSCIIL